MLEKGVVLKLHIRKSLIVGFSLQKNLLLIWEIYIRIPSSVFARWLRLKLTTSLKASYYFDYWNSINRSSYILKMFLFWLKPSARKCRLIRDTKVVAYFINSLIYLTSLAALMLIKSSFSMTTDAMTSNSDWSK
jgi:hypothetical protein